MHLPVDRPSHSDPAALPFPSELDSNLTSAELAQCMICKVNAQKTPTLKHPGHCGEVVSNAPAEVWVLMKSFP